MQEWSAEYLMPTDNKSQIPPAGFNTIK